MSPDDFVEGVRAIAGISPAVERALERSEGFRGDRYLDSLGKPTIGMGTLLPLSKPEGRVLLLMRAAVKNGRLVKALAKRGIELGSLPEPARETLQRMAYQMGVSRLMRFRRMLAAVADQRWLTAYAEALDSRWARQTPARAKRVAGGFLKSRG